MISLVSSIGPYIVVVFHFIFAEIIEQMGVACFNIYDLLFVDHLVDVSDDSIDNVFGEIAYFSTNAKIVYVLLPHIEKISVLNQCGVFVFH